MGNNSIADEPNTVSFGSVGNERRISNVAAGISDTDAVNYAQLSAISSDIAILSSGDSGTSSATGSGSLALGAGASARNNDTAIGYRSTVTADGSTAVGANTAIYSTNSVAVGADATVESGAAGGTAVGQGARVTSGATNSVALGNNSIADEPNTVSVGSVGNERRITNVAPGVNSTDAVNKGQLDQTNARVSKNASNIAQDRGYIYENRAAIEQNSETINRLENSLDDLRDESRSGIAAAAALIELMPSTPGKTTVNLGSATYQGAVAVGLTAVHRLSGIENMMLNTGISAAGEEVLVRAGVSWEF
ncbi:YadA-like family protein [Desulfofustis limnaeus]|uniref:Uncharacterized protein n=1 Tax=Desulfofustis limnaeus TaxID=2740163 RepID=A0ABM7WCK9_9BACT|nr:YadA-like family protein [Desulfofustis limnaeus]BDD88632.1 hypothetical protein DPPLL_29970 [Desulfofustis limnaeus]